MESLELHFLNGAHFLKQRSTFFKKRLILLSPEYLISINYPKILSRVQIKIVLQYLKWMSF